MSVSICNAWDVAVGNGDFIKLVVNDRVRFRIQLYGNMWKSIELDIEVSNLKDRFLGLFKMSALQPLDLFTYVLTC